MAIVDHISEAQSRKRGLAVVRAIGLIGAAGAGQRLLRWLSFAVLIGLIVLFIREQQGQWGTLSATLKRAEWRWIGLAVLAQFAVLLLTVFTYTAVLRKVGHRPSWRSVTTVCMRNIVVSTVSPLGVAGSVVAMKTLNDQGVPGDDAVFAIALIEIVNYASGMAVLLPAAALLAIDGHLPEVVLVAVVLMSIVLAVIGFLLARLLGSDAAPPWIGRLLPGRVTDFIERARTHGLRLQDLLPALAWAIAGELASVAILGATLHAIDHRPFPVMTPLIGYEVGNAAGQVAPVYQGIGAVEISMVLALRHEGLGHRAALASTLLYRVGTLWLPFALALTWQMLQRFRPAPSPAAGALPVSAEALTPIEQIGAAGTGDD